MISLIADVGPVDAPTDEAVEGEMDRRVARRVAGGQAAANTDGPPPWSIDADGALAALATKRRGLTAADAALRLARHGPNELPAERPLQAWRLLSRQFASPLVLLLVAASGISFALGEHIQTTIIVVMVALGGLLAFVQEYRSERAVRALGERSASAWCATRRCGATERRRASTPVRSCRAMSSSSSSARSCRRTCGSWKWTISRSTSRR
ncbi:MAG: hypothetical protein IT332_14965 [Ardenticatenales bacterium]|nr:hypothetical protein [Ardenticatenales bacterium]